MVNGPARARCIDPNSMFLFDFCWGGACRYTFLAELIESSLVKVTGLVVDGIVVKLSVVSVGLGRGLGWVERCEVTVVVGRRKF